MTTLALLGAHTALAQALLACIEDRDLDIEVRRLTTSDELTEGLDLLTPEAIASADLAVLAFSGPTASALLADARKARRPLLDLAGVAQDEVIRRVWPVLDPRSAEGHTYDRTVAITPGLAGPLVAVLRALAPLSPRIAFVATYESAAAGDRPAMDALSEEVRSIFTLREIERPWFGEPLAFNVLPAISQAEGPFADGAEALTALVAGALEHPLDLRVARAWIPTFSAEAAAVELVLDGTPERAAVEAALREARGLRYFAGDPPPAKSAIDRDDTLVGRLVVGRGRVSLWLAVDRLRAGSAAQGVLFIEQWLALHAAC